MDDEKGWPFVGWMISALCAACGLAALLGVPAAGGIFSGLAGMLLGIGVARVLLPRGNRGLKGRTVLLTVAMVGLLAGYWLSGLDFSTARGLFFWGLSLGFWPAAASRLARPAAPRRTGG